MSTSSYSFDACATVGVWNIVQKSFPVGFSLILVLFPFLLLFLFLLHLLFGLNQGLIVDLLDLKPKEYNIDFYEHTTHHHYLLDCITRSWHFYPLYTIDPSTLLGTSLIEWPSMLYLGNSLLSLLPLPFSAVSSSSMAMSPCLWKNECFCPKHVS